MSPEAAPYSA